MKISIHNAETGKTIERAATEEELADFQAINQELETAKLEQEVAKAALETKKQEVLAKLGLTSDEVAALLA